MTGALGDKITELLHHLDTDPVIGERFVTIDDLAQFRIQILVALPQPEHPGLVVDARDHIAHVAIIDPDALGQFLGRALHAVAQSYIFNGRAHRVQPGQHAHRIGVVEHQRVWAVALHVLGEV